MDQPRDVTFYLDPGLLDSASAGQHNFIRLIAETVTDAGFRVFYRPNGVEARAASADLPGYALFHMDDPTHPRALTLRRSYFYPFWQIETSARRWEWAVARSDFPKDDIDEKAAKSFYDIWRKRLFPQASHTPVSDGPIYIPLQGLIRRHRSFQACSPVDMVARTAQRFPHTRIIVTRHPKETYDAADHAALKALEQQHPQVELTDQGMVDCLNACQLVVTENSSVALAAAFFRKPSVLFALVDFHHIAGNVPRDGEDLAFAGWQDRTGYEKYVYWFLQIMAINAGRPPEEAQAKIAAVLRRHGWPLS